MSAELNWTHDANEIPAGGLERTRRASDAERVALAEALDLLALKRLDVRYRIRPIRRDSFLLRGELSADVEQACGVSLDPVTTTLEAEMDVEFWPEARIAKQAAVSEAELELDPFAADEPEPLAEGKIDVGRIVYEHLASAVEPYPRLPDAALDQDQAPVPAAGDAASDPDNPFAVLAKLKDNAE